MSDEKRHVHLTLKTDAQGESRINKLAAVLDEGKAKGEGIREFLLKALLDECDSRGILVEETLNQKVKRLLEEGKDDELGKMLVDDLKLKHKVKPKK